MSRKAEFHRALCKLTDAAADADPIVSAAARAALDRILAEAERILHRVMSEQFILEGWNHEGKPTDNTT